MAISDKDGNLEIPNVPAGKWTFIAWHEEIGWIKLPKVNDHERLWPRGRFDAVIEPDDDCDLGTIKLSASLFKRD